MDILQSNNPLSIYHVGPPLEQGPLPAVFYFAISGEESLLLDPFNQFVRYLQDSPIRIFSFTLPGHGPGQKKENAILFAAEEFKAGRDPFAPFLIQAKENIDYLLHQNWIDKNKIAAAGLSRGGLVAALLTKDHPNIQTLIAFAPITDLTALIPEAKAYNLLEYPEYFITKQLRFYIGNRDERVSTDCCFSFIRKVADNAFANQIRSPTAELIITPSIGYLGHGTPSASFKDAADWLKKAFIL